MRVCAFLLAGTMVACNQPAPTETKPVAVTNPPQAGQPYTNRLGMAFVPVKGAAVLFSVWQTRVQDFTAFVVATEHNAISGMYSTTGSNQKRAGNTWERPGFPQGPTHPVCGVSWDDAQAFCAWLTKTERAAGRLLPTQSYRLPTDLEWSAAVGLANEGGYRPADRDGRVKDVYPWGEQWPPPRGTGNYAAINGEEDAYPHTAPVGSFKSNPFGLYDLGSNLREWCEEYYTGPADISRVQRGASWNDNVPLALLSATRRDANPGRRADTFGFRCVLVVAP
jgi:formylglycine-generating enzyme required for sulfatase activity